MNVNCKTSEELFNNNNEKFGNLRLGPQLMKDVKKMLTHPMLNPYDKNAMKGNLIVMQEYKPPYGQLFPNEALIAGPERTPNNVYIPAKQSQFTSQGYNINDIEYTASTPNPRYLPAAFNSIQQSTIRDTELFQKQRQNGQYTQNIIPQNEQIRQKASIPSNTHAGQFTQTYHNANFQFTQPTQSYSNANIQYGQKQVSNIRPTQTANIHYTTNTDSGQLNQQISQYKNNNGASRLVNEKQSQFDRAYFKQQYNAKQENQPYTYSQPQLQFSDEINGKSGSEAKQNLVSENEVPSTVITKTLTLKRIIPDPKHGIPKSRITVKTWIVKPSKSAKLINSTPYTYDKPTQSPKQKLRDATPYVYNRPTQPPMQKLRNTTPYVYNRLTQPPTQKLRDTTPYVYNRPTVSEKLITELDQPYTYNKPKSAKQLFSSTSTTPRPILSRLYLSPISMPPTQASRLYLAPTTYNPSSRLYLPPEDNTVFLSRQYLAPLQTVEYESDQLRGAPTTPQPTYVLPNSKPTLSRLQASSLSPVRNDLSFTDILTKEKLDLTVEDIVKDTSKYLNTASPEYFEQIKDLNSINYPEENYLPPETKTDSGESLTSITPPTTANPKSSRLISSPSTDLEPPEEPSNSNENEHQQSNQISNLPFFKEPFAPTIERTVSLKISIPEKIATYLFKKHNESDFDKLEILNTGSSNYLVLTNNNVNKKSNTNFIPIGKLVTDKQSNISTSQALVFNLLADSINVAKEYNNAQKDTIESSPIQTQFKNINNEELTQITDKISELTSSQYSHNQDKYKSAKIISTTNNNRNHYIDSSQNQHSQNQVPQLQVNKYNSNPSRVSNENQPQSTLHRNRENVQTDSKQTYSGQLYQLPVPDVTKQIYNQNFNSQLHNGGKSNADVEIIKSESIPVPPAARLQATPTSEVDSFNSQENFSKFISSNNGISAHLQDKIVGTIPHPLQDNKLVTYKKDESYYVYTKLNNNFATNIQTNGNNQQSNNAARQQNARLIQENNLPNGVTFQLIPSVSYQLEDEKEQQKLFNAFHIDENGIPKQKGNLIGSNQPTLTSDVNYSVDHTLPTRLINKGNTEVSNLYAGPSSYSAPQASIGKLVTNPNLNSKLELESNDNGYPRINPRPQFTF
ncbi:unnamed protein product [Diatraea saccharalis]|uniref:Uncharacterized protein n=1 Tax=Diatraea saccharalis TaxID=40085 RepID=A0A9N9RFB1_9NEOP|nr:unnamed protein product [Diatraea saccharalis]